MDWGRVISVTVAVLGVLVTATSNLTDIFGAPAAHAIVSISGLLMAILSAVNGAWFQGQTANIKAVEAMPGVSKILTNTLANDNLKAIAASDDHPKVEKSA